MHTRKLESLKHAEPFLTSQAYSSYTPEQQETWATLVERRRPQIEEHACAEYLDGSQVVGIRADRIPVLADITSRLQPRTGWSTTPVTGFMPALAFFEMLGARHFPS